MKLFIVIKDYQQTNQFFYECKNKYCYNISRNHFGNKKHEWFKHSGFEYL